MPSSQNKIRAFADANVLFAGIAFPRWPHEILRHATAGDFKLVLCPLVIEEARRNLQKRYPEYLGGFEDFLQAADYELVPDPTPGEIEANQNLVRDLSDVAIALAAIAARVNYLISADKDLTTQDATTEELRRRIKVVLSGTFLREVMGWSSEELEAIRNRKWSDISESQDELSEFE